MVPGRSGRHRRHAGGRRLEEDAAVAGVRDAGLEPVVSRTHHDDVVAGTVISTDPGPGVDVHKNGRVRISVSLGVLMLTVPEVAGTEVAEATEALAAEGLTLGETSEEYHGTVPEGAVISSSPAAGESVPHDTAVDLVVSAGREPVDLPDVTGRQRGDAVAALEGAGLTVGDVAEAHDDTVPEGAVISQDPAAGSAQLFYRGDTVNLTVSLGPELFEVPDVVGRQVDEASAALEAAGFRVDVEEVLGGFFGTVRAQDPGAGLMLPRGSLVTLTVV
ncbi:PASTA domain-containing protein [Georgenia sp. SUBG003]|uniref:PASTA domain-containing protein n=1 Tax=Georgenia sp. SUBG003 TaxID=1497974 RepID=UPI003AB5AC40